MTKGKGSLLFKAETTRPSWLSSVLMAARTSMPALSRPPESSLDTAPMVKVLAWALKNGSTKITFALKVSPG